MKKNSVKLLICYHKPSYLLKDSVLTPIHVGRANAKARMNHKSENYKWLMNNLIGDDTGENISDRNDSYNEMTAIYWAWKNYDKLGNPDYIGLMHYRRHFIFDDTIHDVVNVKEIDDDSYLEFLRYSEEGISDFVDGYDFLPHMGRVDNVYKHYIQNQRKVDIDLANEIVLEMYPEYKDTMERYYAGNDSNFCNMCIFSRELFFKYCEWIFSILEEFERRVDMTEKRFFISERLTGLFIAKLFEQENLKYKVLPIAFADEPAKVQIAMHVDSDDIVSTAVTLQSMLNNKDEYNSYEIHMFCQEGKKSEVEKLFLPMVSKNEYCSLDIIETKADDEQLPLLLDELLPKVNKCIYISGKVVALKDLGEFYRICSVDDYMAVGVPRDYYDPAVKEKKITTNLVVLNLKRMRMHSIAEKTSEMIKKELVCDINEILDNEVGYLPSYFFVSEHLANNKNRVLNDTEKRCDIQARVLWSNFMVYDELNPEYNNQGIYSQFWWDILKTLPLRFNKLSVSAASLETLYSMQQKEINSFDRNRIAENRTDVNNFTEELENSIEESKTDEINDIVEWENGVIENEEEVIENTEEWKDHGFMWKLKFYYDHNGLKQTVRYAGEKVFSRGDKE